MEGNPVEALEDYKLGLDANGILLTLLPTILLARRFEIFDDVYENMFSVHRFYLL